MKKSLLYLFLNIFSISFLSGQGTDYNLLVMDFEDKAIGQTAASYSGVVCSGNCPIISNDFARSGQHSLKSFIDRKNSETPYRTELSDRRFSLDHNRGEDTQDYWVGFSVYIPSPYPSVKDNSNQKIFQVHSSPPSGATWEWNGNGLPIAMDLIPKSNTEGDIIVRLHGGGETGYGSFQNIRTFTEIIYTYKTDKWIDIVLHFKFSPDTHGFCEIWINNQKLVNYSGALYHANNGPPYPKLGMYIGWRDPNLVEPVTTRLVYHDEYKLAWGKDANYDLVAPKTPISVENSPSFTNADLFYPNPISDGSIIFRKTSEITLLSLLGNKISSYSGISDLNVSGLDKGVYFVVNQEGKAQKLIKQ